MATWVLRTGVGLVHLIHSLAVDSLRLYGQSRLFIYNQGRYLGVPPSVLPCTWTIFLRRTSGLGTGEMRQQEEARVESHRIFEQGLR